MHVSVFFPKYIYQRNVRFVLDIRRFYYNRLNTIIVLVFIQQYVTRFVYT